ncbi:MAG: hypothetical protein OIF57_07945 [Marinobacterium sp.]|nr:hypothetical protein [Marinobacterium sp.]
MSQTQTPTFDQLFTNFEAALNTLLDQQGATATGGASELVATLKAELIGVATEGNAATHQSLGMLQDLLYSKMDNQHSWVNGHIGRIETLIASLDDTYATDSDLAARVQAVNAAMSAADDDLTALVNDRPTVDAVNQLIADARTYTDQRIAAAVQGMTDSINNLVAANSAG